MNCFSTGSREYRYQEILLLRNFWEPRDKNSGKFLSKQLNYLYIIYFFRCCLTRSDRGGGISIYVIILNTVFNVTCCKIYQYSRLLV